MFRTFLVPAVLFATSTFALLAFAEQQAVPSADEQDKALKLLKKIYADDYGRAAKSVAERKAFAETLRAEGLKATDSAPLHYTTLKEAAGFAMQAGEVELAFGIVDDISQAFKIDVAEFRAGIMSDAAKTELDSDSAERIGEAALAMLDAVIDRDAFAVGDQLAAVARACAGKTKNADLNAKAKRVTVQLEVLKKDYEGFKAAKAKLKSAPKDPEANLVVGKFLCLDKGQWTKGLTNLAQGNDESLKKLAERDLAGAGKTPDQTTLGDAWWDLGEKMEDPAKFNLRRRAAHWYGLAYLELTGISKDKVEKRFKAAGFELPSAKIPVGIIRTLQGHTRAVQSCAISSDAHFIVSGGDDDDLRMWDVTSGNQIKTFKGHTNPVWSVAISPDDKFILSGAEDMTVRLWDVQGGKEVRQFPGHTEIVNRVTFSFDGKQALSAGDDNLVFLWEVDSGKQLKKLEGHTKAAWGAAFFKDGTRAVTSGLDNVAIVWDLQTGKALKKFEGHKDGVLTVAVAPNGKQAISAGRDKVIRLWEVETAKEIRTLEGHTAEIYSIAFSPDGKRILSSSQDKSVRLWDAGTGKELHRFDGHTDDVGCVVFSSNSRYAVSASLDQTVKLWGLPK